MLHINSLRLAVFLAAIIVLTIPCFAQESRASLTGRVADSSDAVVVGVKIQATNLNTGVSISTVTNESGVFVIPFLLSGKYRVTAEQSGFRAWLQDNLELRVNDSVDLRIRLVVGNVTETIEVQGGTPLLETANSSVG